MQITAGTVQPLDDFLSVGYYAAVLGTEVANADYK